MTGRLPPPEYFDRLYQNDGDPWAYETDPYEFHKYRATLEALPRRRFRQGLEVGCSIGVFTRMLAPKCERLLGVDGSGVCLARARHNCLGLDSVSFAQAIIPGEFPSINCDLIVLSEVLYYLSHRDIKRSAYRVCQCLDPDGVVILVNYLGDTGTIWSGDNVADYFIGQTKTYMPRVTKTRHPQYRIDVLSR